MRRRIFILVAAIALLLSCTKNYHEVIVVENVNVEFKCKSVLNVETEGFKTRSTAAELPIPTTFKAYFVSAENKGPYIIGQLITTLDVTSGIQTITVPKIKYNVYVTNYEKEGSWYTWDDATSQLPKSSYDLYLYGKNEIDYSNNTVGEVEVKNPYSAVFINIQYLDPARTPKEYNGNKDYKKFDDDWWYLYTRKNHNSQVWVLMSSINGSPGNKSYQWSDDLEANKIYRFTFNNDPGNTDLDGNFNVVVDPWGDEYDEEINLL